MKFLKNCLIAVGITALFFSCSKTDTNSVPSKGTLQVNDTTGDCLPLTVYGTYTAGVALNASNYIDVWVNTSSIGSFAIATDSVNGMYFASAASETLGTTGANRIRLYSHGKPITTGLTTFNVLYNGSHCTLSIIVGGLAPGSFLLSDTPTVVIPDPVVSGSYTTGVSLNASDSVVIHLLITNPGSVYLKTNSLDGISFSGTGIFTTKGVHSITLTGTGIPQSLDTLHFYALDSLSDTSKFTVIVAPYGGASAAATFTLVGDPNNCTAFASYGKYTAGVEMQASDSVTAYINVTKGGTYSIVTNAANGVVFSTTGKVDSAGQYKISLKAKGLPAAAGTYYYTPTGDSSTCTFGINYGQGGAIFILGGAPGACAVTATNGSYKTGVALNFTNTVTIPITVTTTGAYSITTPTVDGMTFSATGNFVTTGTQSITLTGRGNPPSPGIINFSVPSRTGNCGFTVNVVPSHAEFSFSPSPGFDCSGARLSGKYTAGTALNSGDSAKMTVNVIYPGPYTITTDTAINGMIFTAKGTFTTTGIQTITLKGTGTPKAVGNYNFPVGGGSVLYGVGTSCTFSVSVGNGVVFKPVFTGVVNSDTSTSNTSATVFTHFVSTKTTTSGSSITSLQFAGSSNAGDSIYFSINSSSTITQGKTYTQSSTGIVIDAYYYTNSTAYLGGTPYTLTPVTITLSKLTSTEITGTYSVTLKDNGGAGTNIIKVSSGVFDLQLQ